MNCFTQIDSIQFMREVDYFINKAKLEYTYNTDPVFELELEVYDTNASDYCLTMSYMLNNFDFTAAQCPFVFQIDSELVVARITTELAEGDLAFLMPEPCSDNYRHQLFTKLTRADSSDCTYMPQFQVICVTDGQVSGRFYETEFHLPVRLRPELPPGMIRYRVR